jgi:hypothetical protein
VSVSLPPAASAIVDRWLADLAIRPGALPTDLSPVQTRLVRAVGRGELPGVGCCFVKVMGFPRWRDRLRYVFRALPALHEARMLARLRAAGVPCPEVVTAAGRRRFGLPRVSLLVTRALPTASTAPPTAARAALAARLAELGLFHPDLNTSNFVALRDGRIAVLDLQSARWVGRSLGPSLRRRMAAKLLADGGEPTALAEAGLVRVDELEAVRLDAARVRRRETVRRIRRCLGTSTEFVCERRWNGRLFRRREPLGRGTWLSGGPELIQWWIGQRALEVLDGTPPTLSALFAKSWWLPGEHCVYIPETCASADVARLAPELMEGFGRFRRLSRGDPSGFGRAHPPPRIWDDHAPERDRTS